MSNVLTFSRRTGSSERYAMNHELESLLFTPDKTINVTSKITSIVYNFIFKYTGSSDPSWTGYASIVANDGTEYTGISLTKTITHDTNISMSLTIPETNCPPASVINSDNFKIKLTTTECSKNPYIPETTSMSIVVTYGGAQPYIYNGIEWVPTAPYVYNGSAWVQVSASIYNNEWI